MHGYAALEPVLHYVQADGEASLQLRAAAAPPNGLWLHHAHLAALRQVSCGRGCQHLPCLVHVRTIKPKKPATLCLSWPASPCIMFLHRAGKQGCLPPDSWCMGCLCEQASLSEQHAPLCRNHGAVPRLSWETHQLTVGGLVEKPTTFSMDDLVKKFEAHTICVTLACAGNRRKEQNMVTKTKGFNWGPSATSTGASHWMPAGHGASGSVRLLLCLHLGSTTTFLHSWTAACDCCSCRNGLH